ncbi:hypothetical protein [uncultured Flavobacterium sp.]|uniref:PKD domain-containing protein n=1 Tax=uncultured Flavobacterium sp. TaxID=165435 RepID=UPI0030CA5601
MKKINIIFSFLVLLTIAISCSIPDGISQDTAFDKTGAPTDVASILDITNDNSGKVTFTPSASGAGAYSVYFGDGTANPAQVQFGANVSHQYKEGNYTVKVVANGLNGVNVEKTYPLSIVFRAPENLAVIFIKKGHNLKVKASALYAASFLVYFGDVGADEVGTPLANLEEISHNYTNVGSYSVKLIALSGGLARSEKITVVNINDPFELPITFENPNVIYSFVITGGFSFSKVPNPNVSGVNTSAMVGKFFKVVGSVKNSASTSLLDNPIDFSSGNKVRVWAYNPTASNIGKKLNIELQSAVGGIPANNVAVLKVAFTTSGAWEELVFDFSTISEIPNTAKFNQLVFRFNDISVGRNETFYLDNIRLTN